MVSIIATLCAAIAIVASANKDPSSSMRAKKSISVHSDGGLEPINAGIVELNHGEIEKPSNFGAPLLRRTDLLTDVSNAADVNKNELKHLIVKLLSRKQAIEELGEFHDDAESLEIPNDPDMQLFLNYVSSLKTETKAMTANERADGSRSAVDNEDFWGKKLDVPCSFQSLTVEQTIEATAKCEGEQFYPLYASTEEMNWGVDLAGLWWMDGNSLAEEFVSFTGATTDRANQFPLQFSAPSNLARRWVWPNSIPGRALMAYYAVTAEAETPQIATWHNKSYAEIQPVTNAVQDGLLFVLRQDLSDPTGDTWIRENAKGNNDPDPEYQYTLRRVVKGDGTPQEKNWQKFQEYAKTHRLDWKGLQVWGNDNDCMRACEVAMFCNVCRRYCANK